MSKASNIKKQVNLKHKKDFEFNNKFIKKMNTKTNKNSNPKNSYNNPLDICYFKDTKRKYIRQRAKKGFCDYDCYEMNTWFIHIVPEMLKEIKKHNKSYYNVLVEEFYQQNKKQMDIDAQNELARLKQKGIDWLTEEELYQDYNEFEDEKIISWGKKMYSYADKKADEIFSKMIFLFEECDKEKCSFKNQYKEEYYNIPKFEWTDENGKTIGRHIKNDEYDKISALYHEEENKIYEYREKCLNEALELFVKYFKMLWW